LILGGGDTRIIRKKRVLLYGQGKSTQIRATEGLGGEEGICGLYERKNVFWWDGSAEILTI